ncbi:MULTISPECIES: cytochrome P450 [Cellvibrio]|uniref:Cytochrome P450 n=1 Tax=Cellvibrio fibrivorans TaxID=126350 RepID=A0ABU1UVS1_9GAMM|nr:MULTISPECIES: cytochrome P450 [Cellvibrio]MDR7089256.1 cytochrome P450 [Cellvibrio fibrivorans]QEY12852.1 cytochrome P450 [Cellvibrio sp. KY-YJ-3]
MSKCPFNHTGIPDPFEQARAKQGVGFIDDQNDPVMMVLRHKDLRKCAHDWKTFSSAATPGRIVVPSEVNIRDIRQVPFEVDPPLHGDYRAFLEPWLKRPLEETYRQALRQQISALVQESLQQDSIEAIYDFALPLQSRALTILLNIPYEEADLFISWGTHVFRSEDNPLDGSKAQVLYNYIDKKIAAAEKSTSDDIFSVLLATELQGRKLTHDEIKGIIVLTFAGGRDTVINMVTNTLAYLGENPESLTRLRKEPEIHNRAIEELIRYFSPLTHMGRVATKDSEVCGHAVKNDTRISLCWASANRDATVFENPNEVVLDRKLNPHVGFGFSHHNCLGATHARVIMQILLDELCQQVDKITLGDAQENIENWGEFQRKVGYHKLQLQLSK